MQRSFIIEIFPHNVYLLFQPRILCAMPTYKQIKIYSNKLDLPYITQSNYMIFDLFVNIE